MFKLRSTPSISCISDSLDGWMAGSYGRSITGNKMPTFKRVDTDQTKSHALETQEHNPEKSKRKRVKLTLPLFHGGVMEMRFHRVAVECWEGTRIIERRFYAINLDLGSIAANTLAVLH